jgi:hypothetical protein
MLKIPVLSSVPHVVVLSCVLTLIDLHSYKIVPVELFKIVKLYSLWYSKYNVL